MNMLSQSPDRNESPTSRRDFARNAAYGAFGLAAGLGLVGRPRGAQAVVTTGPTGLTPSQVEGPFFFDDQLIRTDITEGQAGLPMRLDLRVLRIGSAQPVPGARVAVWHSNSEGEYAGFAPNPIQSVDTRGRNYFRGVQIANQSGDVSFHTIYPGWYPDRTAHIHFKVIEGGQEALTSQLYFDDAFTDEIYDFAAPYINRGPRMVRNDSDVIYDPSLELNLSMRPGGAVGSYTICIP